MTVKLNHLRIAPRKVRLVADAIRNKKIEEARNILNFSIKKGSLPILKLLNSAVSNASNSFQSDPSNLYISKITVDEGRKLKRWRARARGSAAKIQKKTSCITLVLDEIEPVKKAKKKSDSAVKSKVKGKKEIKAEKPISSKNDDKKDKSNYRDKFSPASKYQETDKLNVKSLGGTNKIFRRKSI